MPASVQISDQGWLLLSQLAEQTGASSMQVLDAALETYRRQHFLEQANQAYATIAENPSDSASFRKEVQSLDTTLGDGLEKFPA